MDVVSLCPLRVASLTWQPRRGAWALTVVCKATYLLVPPEAELAHEQEYVNEDDNHWNDDSARSLYSPGDLVPFKRRADVMLVGHAFAPRKEPVRSIVTRLLVGELDKAIEVFGERSWSQDGLLREGPRFLKMPVRYERASGGPDTWNPVGMRLDRADAYGAVQVPNLQPPGRLVSDRGDYIEPIGYGPIAPNWPGRKDKLGRTGFGPSGWQEQPIPEDLDPAYFNAAPPDQQVDALRPNERIVLENLHPEHPRLVTSLPGVQPRVFVERRGPPPAEVTMTCDTLWIDTDRSICTLTWRGQVQLEHPSQPGRVLVAMAKSGQRLSFSDVERLANHGMETPPTTDAPPLPAPAPQAPPAPPPLPPKAADAGRARRPQSSPVRKNETLVGSASFEELSKGRGAGTLPFIPPAAGFTSPAAVPERPGNRKPHPTLIDSDEHTNPGVSGRTGTVAAGLPFGSSGPGSTTNPNIDDTSLSLANHVGAGASPAWLSSHPRAPAGLTQNPFSPRPPLAAPPLSPPAFQPPAPPPPIAQVPGDSPWAGGGRPLEASPLPPLPAMASSSIGPAGMSSPLPSLGPSLGSMGSIGQSAMGAMPQPVVPLGNASNSAGGGVIAASNAAAASNPWNTPSVAPATPAPAATAAPAPRIARAGARDVVELLWFHPESLDSLRAHVPWQPILEEVKPKAKPKDDFDFDEEPPSAPPAEVKAKASDRRDVTLLLTRADPTDAEGVGEAITDAVSDEGVFSPPLVLLSGELQFPFDELETLKATVTAVTPLIAGDKKLKETVDTVNELLKTPWLQSSSGVAEGLTSRVKEAFAAGNRMLPASYLDSHTERMLLEQRHYQKRTVLGEVSIRSLLLPSGLLPAIPAYLPEALAKQLPMFQKLKARIIAEALMQQDENEAHPTALRVVALGRVMVVTGRRREPSKKG